MGKSKISLILSVIALLCILLAAVGTTVSLLMSLAGPVENVFTIGNIDLSLVDSAEDSYQLIPGKEIKKDPTVIVGGGSEDCWLFIKVTKTDRFDDYLISGIDSGWTHLGGYDGVYYRQVIKSASGNEYRILADGIITVKDTLTEEKMSAITTEPEISFKAYAIQSHTIDTANDAWKQILEEVAE